MNILGIYNCYGCGVCAIACPRKIIDIKLNSLGFYEPQISNLDECINCGICRDVCSFCHNDISLKEKEEHSYAAWSKDHLVRRKCSSGGVGFEIGKYLISQGYKVCGVRYNVENNRAEHYVASTIKDLIPSVGSKYIQSYTVDGFNSISRKEKYLVTGAPCQIDSFRRYIRKFRCEKNFILLDFFCHGVPTMLLWKKYTEWAEKQVGKITYASWRNKWTGWHDSWAMGIDGEEHGEKINWHDSYDMLIREKKSYIESRLSQGDMFYQLFLGDCCLGKQCYEHCKYKYDQSSADIRIGDLWGQTYKNDEDGVSGIVAFTKIGDEILHKSNCQVIEHPLAVIAEGQMKKNPVKPFLSYVVMYYLKKDKVSLEFLSHLAKMQAIWVKLRRRILNPKRTMLKLLKKIV